MSTQSHRLHLGSTSEPGYWKAIADSWCALDKRSRRQKNMSRRLDAAHQFISSQEAFLGRTSGIPPKLSYDFLRSIRNKRPQPMRVDFEAHTTTVSGCAIIQSFLRSSVHLASSNASKQSLDPPIKSDMAVLSHYVALWYLSPETSVQCLGSAHCLLGLPWLTRHGLQDVRYKWTLFRHVFDSVFRRTPRHTDSGEHSGNHRTIPFVAPAHKFYQSPSLLYDVIAPELRPGFRYLRDVDRRSAGGMVVLLHRSRTSTVSVSATLRRHF
jgi:hypothetical protein